jgi:hypothetical protein
LATAVLSGRGVDAKWRGSTGPALAVADECSSACAEARVGVEKAKVPIIRAVAQTTRRSGRKAAIGM